MIKDNKQILLLPKNWQKNINRLGELIRVGRILFIGYDFFISYTHEDGQDFAKRLEDTLTAREFVVFRDTTQLHGGEKLSLTIQAAVFRTRRLVVVGTRAAVRKPWIK